MKEDRMLNDIELENVAAGAEAPEGRAAGILEFARTGLEGIHKMLFGRLDGAHDVFVMIECIETMQGDFSTRSNQMVKIRDHYSMAMKSDMLEKFKENITIYYDMLIKEIGE